MQTSSIFLYFCYNFYFLILFAIALAATVQFEYNYDERNTEYWLNNGREALLNTLKVKPTFKQAKNVIIFIGDGMSMSTVTGARMLKGQLKGRSGVEGYLSFERFPHTGLAKTYNVDRSVPDSAGTATAFLCGVKTSFESLKVNGKVKSGETDCDAIEENKITSIMDWANAAGKSTGIVTTTRITHATPAASYASTSTRYWECDSKMPKNISTKCKDIARQLVENEPGIKFKVIMGGGRKNFYGKTTSPKGIRKDGLNLIEKWLDLRRNEGLLNNTYHYVTTKQQLNQLDLNRTEYLIGLFNNDHMNFDRNRNNEEPSLAEMTDAAIRILNKNEKGYVLLVESGLIDLAHHSNMAAMALYDTLALDASVATALKRTSLNDTLVIVTSDHSHSFTINGYPKRGESIFGHESESGNLPYPYTILMYSSGPGHKEIRDNPLMVDTSAFDYKQYAAVHTKNALHTGEDMAVYSNGPMAYLLQGVQEQTHIAHVAAYALCIGNYKYEPHCSSGAHVPSSAIITSSAFCLLFTLLILSIR